jgi:transposase, IS605 orfB family
MQQLYTYETELKPKYNQDIIDYFNDYTILFNKIVRSVWQYYNHQDVLINQKAKLNTFIQNQFDVSKRTAGSIISYVSGRYNSLKESKKYEIKRNSSKIEKLDDLVSELALKLDIMAMKAHHNQLKEKGLIKYRWLKAKFVAIKKAKDRLLKENAKAQKQLNDQHFSLCFGSKTLFNHQYLEADHQNWYNRFKTARDGSILFVGSKDETCCNLQLQLIYNKKNNQFTIQLRKEYAYQANERDKYLYGQVYFSYGNKELQKVLKTKSSPITYRIMRRDDRYFLQAIITIEKNDITEQDRYAGIDFNKGFITLSEVKEDGNLINTDKIYYRFKQGNKTTNDLRQLALDIAIRCKENNMSLAIENLNFGKKKSKTSKYKKDEKYNDMLHSLAYSKFDEYISRACFANDIWLSRVNPAYTSYIGKKKYNEIKKLNTHTSASYVIARRSMRFKDAA